MVVGTSRWVIPRESGSHALDHGGGCLATLWLVVGIGMLGLSQLSLDCLGLLGSVLICLGLLGCTSKPRMAPSLGLGLGPLVSATSVWDRVLVGTT